MAARVLVVNADDFGLSPGVNAGILQATQRGIVTSLSLMVNGPAAQGAFEILREHPQLDVGVHLNATDFVPLLPSSKVSALIDGEGRFLGLNRFLLQVFTSRATRLQVAAEWREQICRALALGVSISHLDSHHHVHMVPWLFEIAASLAEEFRIPFIRVSDESKLLGASQPASAILTAHHPRAYRFKRYLLSLAARMVRSRKDTLRSADFFIDTFLPNGPRPLPWLKAVVSALPPGVTELICHPGLADGHLAVATSYTTGRQREFDQLTDASWPQFLTNVGVTLSSFRELATQ